MSLWKSISVKWHLRCSFETPRSALRRSEVQANRKQVKAAYQTPDGAARYPSNHRRHRSASSCCRFAFLRFYNLYRVIFFFLARRMDVSLQAQTKPLSTLSAFSYIPTRRKEPKEMSYFDKDSKVRCWNWNFVAGCATRISLPELANWLANAA